MPEQRLGMQWGNRGDDQQSSAPVVVAPPIMRNTRVSLWPDRWPAIAKQECIDEVEAAPDDKKAEVKFNLPCQMCEMAAGCLNAKRKEIGSLMYDREILTSPRTSESSLFPRTLMAPMLNPALACTPQWLKPFGVEHEYQIVQAWDIAWSERVGGDWLVCMTGSVHLRSGRRTLLDVQRWRQVSFDDQVKMIEEKWRTFGADLVVIEGDAAQHVWKQHVDRNTAVPVVSHSAGDGKQSLSIGVPSLLIKFENRKWEIPFQPGSYHHDEVQTFLNELEAFGYVDGKLEGVGEHDDTVMAFWHLNWGIDKMVLEGPREMHRGMQEGRQA